MASEKQGEGQEREGGGEERQSRSERQDLKEREYRDEKGEVHHHTRTSKEMKDKE